MGRHKKFTGTKAVTQTVDLICDNDGPVAQATVVCDQNNKKPHLQLDYKADSDLQDNEGFIGIRWTKEDLQRMITLIDLTEEILNEQRRQEDKNG